MHAQRNLANRLLAWNISRIVVLTEESGAGDGDREIQSRVKWLALGTTDLRTQRC